MRVLIRNFRTWWQPPRKAGERPEHRQVTFLELFYDLVYVVIIAQLSHALSAHISWAGLGHFAFLFVIVWWAWFNGITYHDLHGNNDIRTRVFTFLQMLSVVAMAVFAHDALGKSSVGFALSYAVFQEELEYCFQGYIEDLQENSGWSREQTLLVLAHQYNGYRFCEKDVRVYNPFSVLHAFNEMKLRD